MTPGQRVLHLALRTEWADARRTGEYRRSTRGRTLAEVGFVHAAAADQVDGVRRRFYADLDPADLVLLVLDGDGLAAAGSPVVWEDAPDCTGPYPHVYGPVPVAAVVAELAAGEAVPVERLRVVATAPFRG